MSRYHIAQSGKKSGMMVACRARAGKCPLVSSDGQPAHHGDFASASDADKWNRIQTAINLGDGTVPPLQSSLDLQQELEHMHSVPESVIAHAMEAEAKNQFGGSVPKKSLRKPGTSKTKTPVWTKDQAVSSTDPNELKLMMASNDPNVRNAALSNNWANHDDLVPYMESNDEDVLSAVAKNDNVSDAELNAMMTRKIDEMYDKKDDHFDPSIGMKLAQSVLSNPNAGKRTVDGIINGFDATRQGMSYKQGIHMVASSLTNKSPLFNDYMNKCMSYDYDGVGSSPMGLMAQRDDLPSNVVDGLCNRIDDTPYACALAGGGNDLSSSQYDKLLKNVESAERASRQPSSFNSGHMVSLSMAGRRGRLDGAVQRELVKSQYDSVRKELTKRNDLTEETQMALAQDRDNDVRLSLASNSKNPKVLSYLADTGDENTRMHAAYRLYSVMRANGKQPVNR